MSRRHRPPTKEFAEAASRVKHAAARASGQSMRAGIEMFHRNGEIVQHTVFNPARNWHQPGPSALLISSGVCWLSSGANREIITQYGNSSHRHDSDRYDAAYVRMR
jgi:hypothetical protein